MTRYIQTNAHEAACRYLGVKQRAGADDHPLIRWWHSLTYGGDAADEVPWCSSFVSGVAFELGLSRTKSKAARSWLAIGEPVLPYTNAEVGLDVVIFKRGTGPQPGPAVLNAPGHVAVFDSWAGAERVRVVGGNQGNAVSIATFPIADILGIRRLSAA